MTRERREEVVLVALVVSIAVHVALMILVRPKVMTRPVTTPVRGRPMPMRVVRAAPPPESVRIDELIDLKAVKDAPAVSTDRSVPRTEAPAEAVSVARVPEPETKMPAQPEIAVPVFEAKPEGDQSLAGTSVPVLQTQIETPMASSVSLTAAPSVKSAVEPASVPTAVPEAPRLADDPGLSLPPEKLVTRTEEDRARAASFQPAKEVYEKVDEKVVAEEKAAVRDLVTADEAADLVKFVNVTMSAQTAGDWRYFRVMMTPRTSLKTVPKDVVMVIDGSGSIGNDRLGSCRKAARRILRSCTNTGDRFNLVVFRNAFSYAFRSWRECDAPSFEAGDKWLSRQTAHGRTDVFSTISSVLTLPRDPSRPLVALVVTDGDANAGVSDTAEILRKFTALNDGLVSVYMYGVKSSANRELIDVLTHGNRGESFVFEGWRWNAGEGLEGLSERFRDPVLTDLRAIFSAETRAETYPRLLRNLYRGDTLSFVGRVPARAKDVAFSLRGINGSDAYEGFFRLPFDRAPADPSVAQDWEAEAAIDRRF